ncbi:hypothetical protein FGG08_005316 [Glutinoglossum americanum]|uniref:Uncharacterized protein n=1 Tax=Glutinoglossum americanum TaxID=1670608 RepID=A0A9P8I0I1_9PEZI|nr:hypothetical protein FGG08_005316 [Glutinoglossum americanum]
MDYVKGDICGGHIQVLEDEDAFGTQGRKTRRHVEEREKVTRVLHGKKGLELFLQCYQLILWKQVHWLIKEKGFPSELEIVTRDLWALRLQNLKTKAGDTSESDTQPTFFTSTSEESGSATSYDRRRRPKHRWLGKDIPKLLDTLGLCYLGMLLLRLPCSLGDIHKWAEDESIIYIRAIRFIPKEMRSRLPAQGFGALDTRSVLKPDQLQRAVRELVLYYHREFGILFPAINSPLLSFKYIRDLALPLDIYLATKELANILGYSFAYQLSGVRHRITELPELRLMSLIVVALKLVQSFDGRERSPKTDNEAASLVVDWGVWRKSIEEPIFAPGCLPKGGEINMAECDVFNLSKSQLDQYMDWYEKMWVDDAEPKMPEHLLRLFPPGRAEVGPTNEGRGSENNEGPSHFSTDEQIIGVLRKVQGSLKHQKAFSSENTDPQGHKAQEDIINRPGSQYKTYRREDDLPLPARALYEAAAKAIGISVKTLIAAIVQAEWGLQMWAEADRKMAHERANRAETEGGDHDGSEATNST